MQTSQSQIDQALEGAEFTATAKVSADGIVEVEQLPAHKLPISENGYIWDSFSLPRRLLEGETSFSSHGAGNHSNQAIAVHRGHGATTDGAHKALVSIGGGKVAQFECEAEPPKPRVARQPQQRLPANWRKIRGKVLAKSKKPKPKPKPKPDDGTVINQSFIDGMQGMFGK